jgi:hypothetical protein
MLSELPLNEFGAGEICHQKSHTPCPMSLPSKYFFRKHGPTAYYGQKREVPVWLAVVIIVVVLVVIAGIYAWLGSPRRQEGGTVAKPPATVIPGQGAQQQPP